MTGEERFVALGAEELDVRIQQRPVAKGDETG